MEQEIWKDIEGYEGLYQCSNLGNIKSLERIETTNGIVNKRTRGSRILKPIKNHRGYILVRLSKNGIAKSYQVHRIIAKHFILNPDNLPQVNHKDEDKTNNCVDNLEWCTSAYNSNYGDRNKKIGGKLINHPNLSKSVLGIKDDKIIYYFKSTSEAERNGFDHSKISSCCQNKPRYKTHKGYKWQYFINYLADWLEDFQNECMKEEKEVA